MMVKLFDYQEEALNLVLERKRYALFMEQGTGKTMVAIKALEHWYNEGTLNRVIIFIPNSIVHNWLLELDRFLEVPYIVDIMDYTKAKREKVISEFNKLDTDKLQILLLNYEKAQIMRKDLIKFKPDAIICDESQNLKSRTTKTSKAVYSISRKARYCVLMSGTPIGNGGVDDLFMQFKIMDDSIFGTNHKPFEDHYLIKGGYMGKEIIGTQNEEELKRVISEHSFRIKIDEVSELPPLTMNYHQVNLSKDAQRTYNELKEEMLTQVDYISTEIERTKLKEICRQNGIIYHPRESYASLLTKAEDFINLTSADLVVTQLIKLQQIAGGFLIQDDGTTIQVDSTKIEVVGGMVKDSKGPVLIFCRFKAELEALNRLLSKNYRVGLYQGKQQGVVYGQFQNGELDVLLLQIQTGSVGLNLQLSSHIIFYSWNFSSIDYTQAIARIKRTGQKKPMVVTHIIAKGTVDEEMLSSIQRKHRIAAEFLGDKI